MWFGEKILVDRESYEVKQTRGQGSSSHRRCRWFPARSRRLGCVTTGQNPYRSPSLCWVDKVRRQRAGPESIRARAQSKSLARWKLGILPLLHGIVRVTLDFDMGDESKLGCQGTARERQPDRPLGISEDLRPAWRSDDAAHICVEQAARRRRNLLTRLDSESAA